MRVEWIRNEVNLLVVVDDQEITISMTPAMAEVASRGLSLGAAHARTGATEVPTIPVTPLRKPSPIICLDDL